MSSATELVGVADPSPQGRAREEGRLRLTSGSGFIFNLMHKSVSSLRSIS